MKIIDSPFSEGTRDTALIKSSAYSRERRLSSAGTGMTNNERFSTTDERLTNLPAMIWKRINQLSV